MTLKVQFGVGCDHASRSIVRNQADEPIAWQCNHCPAYGSIEFTPVVDVIAVSTEPPRRGRATVPTLDECDWCGNNIDRSAEPLTYRAKWIRKRYCSEPCYLDDLEDRRDTRRPITNADRSGRGKQLLPEPIEEIEL